MYNDLFPAFESDKPEIHIGDCPDLGPILMALAAAKNGAVFYETARLKIKESDRGTAMAEELAKFNVSVSLEENMISVEKSDLRAPVLPLCGHNDHRIVMSLCTLLTFTGGVIEGAEAVNKSFPDDFKCLRSLGAEVIIHET